MKCAFLFLAVLLQGCASTVLQPVKVPVPVECRVGEPARPAMPTDTLQPGVAIDTFAAAAQAEITLRDGYEGELLAALRTCTEPIAAQ